MRYRIQGGDYDTLEEALNAAARTLLLLAECNLQRAIKTIREVYDAGLFKGGPNETALFLAEYRIKQAAIDSGKKCNDRTALKKLMVHMGFSERGGPSSTLCRKLKTEGVTLEQIAKSYAEIATWGTKGTKRTP